MYNPAHEQLMLHGNVIAHQAGTQNLSHRGLLEEAVKYEDYLLGVQLNRQTTVRA